MNVPDFDSREEFERYLNDSDSRLEAEAKARSKRSVLVGVSLVAILVLTGATAIRRIDFEKILSDAVGYDPREHLGPWAESPEVAARFEEQQRQWEELEEMRRKQIENWAIRQALNSTR